MHYYKVIPKVFAFIISLALISLHAESQKYMVEYHLTDKDTTEKKAFSFLQSTFDTKTAAEAYINTLPHLLSAQGYASASVDSVVMDTTAARVFLFVGNRFTYILTADSLPPEIARTLRVGREDVEKEIKNPTQIKKLETGILNYYENTGYPFAKVFTDSRVINDTIFVNLKTEPGVLYHLDSIRIIGDGKIKNSFLQHYLGIYNGDIYNRSKLAQVNNLINNLPYFQQYQAWDLMMLGTGATLNLYLHPRRSSEINALIGFLPSATVTGKTKVTADVRLNLKNTLSGGETILVNWQQLDPQSPKLNLGFNQPYIFNSRYGIDFSFGMLKKDSAYLQLSSRFGIEYLWSGNQTISVFYQINNNNLLQGGVDTNSIRFSKRLPINLDTRSASGGLSYHFNNLDYRFNPRKGWEITASLAAGIRKVLPNNDILKLKDPLEPDFDFATLYDSVRLKTYQVTGNITTAHYKTIGKNSVLKLGVRAGWLASPQIFQNEMFRIGGYKTLRGFDEESIYVNRYGIGTAEYRLLTGVNSYLFGFVDYGLTNSALWSGSIKNSFVSTGLGLELETGFGLLNVSYAIGKRNDIKFDIRNASKIHLGYINYF